MLAQDVHKFVPKSYLQVEPTALKQAKSKVIIFQNDTRWSGYVSWATFLGFGQSDSGKASGGFITDPTRALTGVVEKLVPKKQDLAVKDFLAGLVDALPVLDGGDYRKKVEGNLKKEKWKAPGEDEVSTSLSRGLFRLESQGVIRLEMRSDADAQVRLVGLNRVVGVTHIQRGGAK